MPKRTRTAQGPTTNFDFRFLQPGQTTRAEVLEKLQDMDAGLKSDHYFVGRYSVSKWGGWLILGTEDYAQSAGRMWGVYNLLVEFDDKGVVTRQEIFGDRLLIAKLTPIARQVKLAPEERMDLLGNNEMPLTVTLLTDTIEVQEEQGKRLRHYKVPRDNLMHVTRSLAGSPGPIYTGVVLHFSKNLKIYGGPGTSKLRIQLTVPQLITFLSYSPAH